MYLHALFGTVNSFALPCRYVDHMSSMVGSMLDKSGSVPVTLVLLTDSLRPMQVKTRWRNPCGSLLITPELQMIKKVIGKYMSNILLKEKYEDNQTTTELLKNYISSEEFRKKKAKSHPDIKIEFLDINSIIKRHNDTIQEMKKYFGPNNKSIHISPTDQRKSYYFSHLPKDEGIDMVFPPRYSRDLFYIAPFYHLELPTVQKLIVVDLDIEFRYWRQRLLEGSTCLPRCSVSELSAQFEEFSDSEMMSIASNQSPYYYLATAGYRCSSSYSSWCSSS